MRKLDVGSLPDRVTISTIGDRTRVAFKASTGEEIGADLSREQATKLRDALNEILSGGS